jgi:CRISPR-associated protein Csb2
MIRRVCIFAPPELSDAIRLMRNVLPGRILTDNEGKEVCRLAEARSNSIFEHYTNTGTEFETVTPAVFPHHLTKNGRLDSRRVREAAKWFTEAGAPEPMELFVQFQREKFFAPTYMQKLPQYRLRARFDHAVFGPIAVGLGRFSGLGIFANRSGLGASARFATNGWQAESRTVEEISAY